MRHKQRNEDGFIWLNPSHICDACLPLSVFLTDVCVAFVVVALPTSGVRFGHFGKADHREVFDFWQELQPQDP